jgi:hypothetical protein
MGFIARVKEKRDERRCERYVGRLTKQFKRSALRSLQMRSVTAQEVPMPVYFIAKVDTITMSGQPTQVPHVQSYPGVNWSAYIPTNASGITVAPWCIVKVQNPESLPSNDTSLTGFPAVSIDTTLGASLTSGQRNTLAARIQSTFGLTVDTSAGRTLRQVITDICSGVDPSFDPAWLE